MSKIFVSHSTKNSKLAEKWSEFMQMGMGIAREDIFCSSLNRAIPTGKDFINVIKEEMADCKVIIALITPEYLKSKFCMMELGAAWIFNASFCPLLAGGVEYSQLDDTPLKSMQMRKIENEKDVCAIYSELCEAKIVPKLDVWAFQEKLPEFLKYVEKSEEENYILPDEDGFYRCMIEQERQLPKSYQCYRVKGKFLIDGIDAKDETHWIFFKKGVYDDLKKGMCVRIKIGSTQLRDFPGKGLERNIYPDELYVEE